MFILGNHWLNDRNQRGYVSLLFYKPNSYGIINEEGFPYLYSYVSTNTLGHLATIIY